jgi:hypothetical protein
VALSSPLATLYSQSSELWLEAECGPVCGHEHVSWPVVLAESQLGRKALRPDTGKSCLAKLMQEAGMQGSSSHTAVSTGQQPSGPAPVLREEQDTGPCVSIRSCFPGGST